VHEGDENIVITGPLRLSTFVHEALTYESLDASVLK